MEPAGKKTWYIPDMYWPEVSAPGDYVSHETICVLNTSGDACNIDIVFYYEDREPAKGYHAVCGPERTLHIRIDRLLDESGNRVPRGVPYAAVVRCSTPAVVQYTRVDTTQPALALASAIAYPGE
jgi:hypothetical protein